MIFRETGLSGAYVIEIEKRHDERGFFARTWCADEFFKRGLVSQFVQCNISHNKEKGTIRGMHYQCEPFGETKFVRCTRGAIYDVIIDLRPESPTYRKWFSVELNCTNYLMLYVPVGFAHGFQTLEDHTDVLYQMSEFYYPDCARGVRWDDPVFNIKWPMHCTNISSRDQSYCML